MTARILDVDDKHMPTVAVCDECNTVWRRPSWDPIADTLPTWALNHLCEARPASGGGPSPAALLLTLDQAAERLAISRSNVYSLVRGGQLRSIKIGKLRRVPVDALSDFIAEAELGADETSR